MAKNKVKLGDIVRPFFEKMGAKVEHGPGVVGYTVTMEQLDHYFKNDPLGKAIYAVGNPGINLTELMKKIEKPKKRKRRKT